ncbi:aminoglycoside adenylyltransferase domain-containing protein [Stackebrandtia nassauensis]|uniref:Adenylyltransferase AadA C-terminal domain-containing protein n=1 Tax=Stackebrandtia nassauensis (strain DSM 44728 / CIP 108903 / NRRL B-16338 / NBRC 102104 / LLR-40K-21) TaxID=446470 RepID=D3Q4Z1_STANL|nr:aminoglycoside adenylyltransferase domain-containing protein [Stackebrandtia nassauensis]ADD42171.1 hypothetical protein Snas_2488 [Stackebrandtia nassauensis DSM 44728]
MSDNPAGPTRYPELNELLDELTCRVGDVLGDNLVGMYLCGSFAVGDADMHSDCDFLAVVRRALGRVQERRIRALHSEIPTRAGHWTQHLEGSYPVAAELKTLESLGREWLYIDHGWREMQFHTHCNNEVTRWSLREHGVTLTGPDPKSLVDEVPVEALRSRMLHDIPRFLEDLAAWASWDVAWTQRYAVTTYCRMLNTLETGVVVSKRAALAWAMDSLDPSWRPLLRQVLDDRERGWDPYDPPRPGSIESTMAFSDYVLDRAGRH